MPATDLHGRRVHPHLRRIQNEKQLSSHRKYYEEIIGASEARLFRLRRSRCSHSGRCRFGGWPQAPEWAKQQSFRFEATGGRSLYVRVEKGTTGFGDYALVKPFTSVLAVEEFPRSVEILHEGSRRARAVAARTMEEVRTAVHLTP